MRAPNSPQNASADADERLLVRLRDGDESAFSELVSRHHATMVRVARSYVSSDAVAEEVTQETWLGVLKGLDRFEQRSSLRTWLFSILVNRALTRGQREARSVPFSSLAPADEDASPTVAAERFASDGAWASPPRPFELPQERAAALELRERLREALGKLPERQAVVVTVHDVEGLESDEVAKVLGLSVNNVRVLLHRGRAKLQAALAEYVLGPQASAGHP